MNQGVFMDFDRNNTSVKIKKAKGFRQANFLRGFANPHSQSDKENTAQLGFCNSQDDHESDDEPMEEIPNESSGGSEEKEKKSTGSDAFSIGVSIKSSQQAIFKQKL
jgi:hypothetical protein